jgi:hypothetical protein
MACAYATPWVLRQGQRDRTDQVCEAGLNGGLLLRGVHPLKATAVVDARVVYPDGNENDTVTHNTAAHHEAIKRKKCQAECDAHDVNFVTFVVTTDGAMSLSAQLLVSQLAQ